MSRQRPSPDAVQIYGWDVASLSARALETLEDRIGPFLEGRQAFHVSTCQRLELVTIGCELQVEADRFYRGDDALLHVARMAAGLDSLVLGEAEILGQVRSALATAPLALQSMLAPAIGAARTLRRESSFTAHAGHALDVALQFAAVSEKGDLLVLGGGPLGRRVAERADNLGFSTTIAARRPLALPQGIGHVAFGRLASLAPVQVIVSCLGRAAPQLSKADLPSVTGVALDLSTPANLMPDLDVPVISLSMLVYGNGTMEKRLVSLQAPSAARSRTRQA